MAPAPQRHQGLVLSAVPGIVQGASFAATPQLNAGMGGRSLAAGALAQPGHPGTAAGTPVLAAVTAAFGPAGVVGFAGPLCLPGILVPSLQAGRHRRG